MISEVTRVRPPSRFEVDYAEYLAQHDIRHRRPPLRAADCLAIGNGDLGLQIDGSGSQLFHGYLMKADVWDYGDPAVDPIAWHVPFSEVIAASGDVDRMAQLEARERLRRYGGDPNERRTMPKPLGKLSIAWESEGATLTAPEQLTEFEQRLSLYDATVETSFQWRGMHTRIASYVHSERNLIIFNVDDHSPRPHVRRALITRGPDPRMPTKPMTGVDGQFVWLAYEFPDGFRYVMVGLVDGPPTRTAADNGRAYLEVSAPSDLSFSFYVAVATSKETTDPEGMAREIVLDAQMGTASGSWESHKRWWHSFWPRSFISISDKEIENAWYSNTYALARAYRGDVPSWLLWAESENEVAWNGAFWDISVNNYLGAFGSNHVEMVTPFLRFQLRCLPAARRNARDLYERAGARFAHAYGPDGLELGVLWPRLMHFASGYVSMLFWWRYLYTQDRTFLSEEAYPVMREVTAFYLDWMQRDPMTGKLFMPPPTCPFNEILWLKSFDVRNNPFELGLVKRLLESVLEASDLLQADSASRPAWREALASLDEMPSDGHVFLEYEGEAPGENPLWTVDAVGCIYPTLAVGVDDVRAAPTVQENLARIRYPTKDKVRFSGAAAAFKGLGDLTDEPLYTPQLMCCPLLAACAAWLGRPDLFEDAMQTHLHHHLLPNGLFGEDKAESPYGAERFLPAFALTESGGDFVGALNEALMKSLYEGVIDLFRGAPVAWDIRLDSLRAVGAFLVTAERVQGDVRYVSVHAEVGGTCRIRVPAGWSRDVLRARAIDIGTIVAEFEPGCEIASFPTDPGRSYVLERAQLPFESFAIERLEAKPSQRRYIGLSA